MAPQEGRIFKISRDELYKSEPPAEWFGNPENKKDKHWTNDNWLRSLFHFSFAEYHSSKNSRFGVLRVMNDDLVQPARGFGTHPHRDMEIMTYIVEGSLTHQDSMGTSETLGRGAVQFMTAGTGVRHSERNLDPERPLRFIQMWVEPRQRSLPPNYGSYSSELADRQDKWLHLASDVGKGAPVQINQECDLYVSELASGGSLDVSVKKDRQAYLLCMEGELSISSTSSVAEGASSLSPHDSAELYGPVDVTLTATKGAHVLLLDMPAGRPGRKALEHSEL